MLLEKWYCSTCDDLIDEVKTKYDTTEKQRTLGRIELDFSLLKDTHCKLASGLWVVSTLLLSSITNILCQSKLVDASQKKVQEIEIKNLTNKTRLEAPEDLALTLNEHYKKRNINITAMGSNPWKKRLKLLVKRSTNWSQIYRQQEILFKPFPEPHISF